MAELEILRMNNQPCNKEKECKNDWLYMEGGGSGKNGGVGHPDGNMNALFRSQYCSRMTLIRGLYFFVL